MSEPIRLLIVDDHELVRQGFKAMMSVEPDVEVIGEAADGVKAVKLAHSLEPDVILLDLAMPRKDGIEATRAIKTENPAARILIITSCAEDDKVYQAVKAGALGYLMKDSSPEALMRAIHDVFEGRLSLHPVIALKLIEELNRPSDKPPVENPLTEREGEVLILVAKGLSNQEIAQKLIVTERTVSAYVMVQQAAIGYGAALLFVYALGRGVPIVFAGTFTGALKQLQRAGRWSAVLEMGSAVLLVGMGLYFLWLA